MLEDKNTPFTKHTTNPVSLCLVAYPYKLLQTSGKLRDISPTMLEIMEPPQPPQMTSRAWLTHPFEKKEYVQKMDLPADELYPDLRLHLHFIKCNNERAHHIYLQFGQDCKFLIMQITDIQDKFPLKLITKPMLKKALYTYPVDLLVLTGDNISSSTHIIPMPRLQSTNTCPSLHAMHAGRHIFR